MFRGRPIILIIMLLVACRPTAKETPTAEQPRSSDPPDTTAGPAVAAPTSTPSVLRGEWLYLDRPPEQPARILASQHFDVYVEAQSGQRYMCKIYRAANGEDCWQPISRLPEIDSWFKLDCYEANMLPEFDFDAPVVQLLVETAMQDDGILQNCYVLLEDGAIWKSSCGAAYFPEDDMPPAIPAGERGELSVCPGD